MNLKKGNLEPPFEQKKINHIFHYTNNFEVLLKILRNGFAPSYCIEKINDIEYYIPMVSFCNIPLRDVDLYLRYGKYGIGMSLQWAIKNTISPVVYIHETTPFGKFHNSLISLHFKHMINDIFHNKSIEEVENKLNENFFVKYDEKSKDISKINTSIIQFFKNWKTLYRKREIITYQEREWRFIPKLEDNKKIIHQEQSEFSSIKKLKKPHLPEYSIKLDDINDIRYILINNETQRKKVLKLLNKTFGESVVLESIISGNLMIINDKLIHDDF
ncbi:hypothetical protein F7018_03910 [Tenacibaculum aiptasiae]|uniref:DUF2971 domain-containing protein n=1 Tax=Tenacibaculum aiptasiae TaxID=426481 RepID=A0A7J5API3_9FLAO|nr:abortive infection system antitoxin AbiGi family protein [Tenacibaculum aiptasiae]KAB1159467.1 hypothetical protein F7018_03910 [Tenacibaculum aiptasiae]